MAHLLLGAGLAEHDRVHRFEVGRVRVHRQVHLVAVELAVRRGAKVVFHVTGAEFPGALGRAALEFVEDLLVRLAHHGRQHVEAPAVRHADHDFLHAERAAALDDLFQRRHRRFAAVEAEALGARITLVQEALEGFRFDQLGEDRLLALIGEGDTLVRTLDPLLQPGFLFRIGDVHELDAERRAIGPLQDLQHLRHGRRFEAEIAVDIDLAAHILGLVPIGGRVKLGLVLRRFHAQRVELGSQMAAHPVGADHHDGADRILDRPHDVFIARTGLYFLDLLFELRLQQGPVAVESGDLLVQRRTRPVAPFPGCPFRIALRAEGIVTDFREEGPPALRNRCRILRIGRLHLLDPLGRAPIQERRVQQGGIAAAARPIHRAAIVCHVCLVL